MQQQSTTFHHEAAKTARRDNAKISAIITVVRDPVNFLGKQFAVNSDGTISKKSAVSVSCGVAVMYRVETTQGLVDLLTTVSEEPQAAIINAVFEGVEVGEDFIILSEREIETRLNIPADDRSRQKGIHQIEYNGKTMKAVGRFKENVRPSCWQLIDRDIDQHTPPNDAAMSVSELLTKLSKILPGIDKVTHVETASTSSRVMQDGKSVGGGNSHVWIRIESPDDIERVRNAVIVLAAQKEMTWLKPRYSRSEPGKVVGQSLTTIIDPSVFTPGRLVFNGKPTVGEGLTVEPLVPVIHPGQQDALNTSVIVLPDAKTVREVMRKAGVEVTATTDNGGLRISANDLKLDTEVETKDHGILTVRDLIARGITGKIRCQTPFRDSGSFAAFLSANTDGIPFVYDSGTNITHRLNGFEVDEVKRIKAGSVADKLTETVKEDGAAVLEDEAVDALATIKQGSLADYQRIRSKLKATNSKVPLTDMDRMVKSRVAEGASAATHHGYAKGLLDSLTQDDYRPVGYQGDLFTVDLETGLWKRLSFDDLVRLAADLYDGEEHCQTSADYRAITCHAISLANNEHFFADAAVGIACSGRFFQILGDEIVKCKLTPDHRQRVMLDFKPEDMPIPLFVKFLHETFESKNEGEEAQQIVLVQEIVGAIMLGLMPRFQKAVLFYDKFGRAGKGTLERCLRGLVPREYVTAVSPFSWSRDYHLASLSHARLNVVGELPDNESIPAAMFKTVIGGDLITGRHPTLRPFAFTNEAANVFMSNHLINTRDYAEAFFSRWLIVEFPNSRLRSGLPLDPLLAERIVESEMPGIAHWALVGAARLIRNGVFSKSDVHDRLMAQWRCTSNSLEEFIGEECLLVAEGQYRRSVFYADYTGWCQGNGRKPFAKGRVKELLEHNMIMGLRLVELNGHETFKGIKNKRDPVIPQRRPTHAELSGFPVDFVSNKKPARSAKSDQIGTPAVVTAPPELKVVQPLPDESVAPVNEPNLSPESRF